MAGPVDFSVVSASAVGRHFGRRKALTQVSFECRAGEIVGLLGPNGAGKSTLLGILATLLRPSVGVVRYGDHSSATGGAALRARLGLLGHDLYLYPELTARENLTFFAHLQGLDRVNARVETALARANLADRADDVVAGFSRGMRQRLALERALVHDPRLLLLDEPFTGLDQSSATALVARLQERRDQGAIVVLATHDLDVVDGVLSRALYLRNGRLVAADGGSDGLRARYGAAMAAP